MSKFGFKVVSDSSDVCKVKDDDRCLQTSRGWGSSYKCWTSTKHCLDWAKDMKRCCPVSCNTGAFGNVDCFFSSGNGSCSYPNDAQCEDSSKNQNAFELLI